MEGYGFWIDPLRYRCDIRITRMSFADRGRLMEELYAAVTNRDPKPLKPWLNFITKVKWPRLNPKARPPIPAAWRRAVLAKHGEACLYCGATEFIEMDHRKAFSRGGAHAVRNLQPLCRTCNRSKGAR
jgi:5-methylcytosine-specific restriction endonuclease McrA